MPLWKIAWRSIQHRSLASGLTSFSMGLGVALVVAVIVIYGVLNQTFMRSAQGYDLIVGPPKGSALDIVLGTVFYSKPLSDTIPYDYFRQLDTGRYSPEVEVAIPIAFGETYKGMRIIATTPNFFTKLRYLDVYSYSFRSGRNMDAGGDFEAVLGYTAAQKTKLKVGDKFKASRRMLAKGEGESDPTTFEVVGILNATGTPNDQAIFVNLEAFFTMNAHDEGTALDKVYAKKSDDKGVGGDLDAAKPKDERRISAVLVLTKEKVAKPTVTKDEYGQDVVKLDKSQTKQVLDPTTMGLAERVVADLDVQVARPVEEISRLFEMMVGKIQIVLIIFAVLVVVVAGIGMMVSIYNSMNERRQEIAIMRALGARRLTVMSIILLESILLSLGGGLMGMVIGHGLIMLTGPIIADAVKIVVNPWHFQAAELILIPGLILLASIVGYLPAVIAYRTDVAQSLNP